MQLECLLRPASGTHQFHAGARLVDFLTRAEIERPEEGIKYYSGKAVYRTRFPAADATRNDPNVHLYLSLGTVKNLAAVKLAQARLDRAVGRRLSEILAAGPGAVGIAKALIREIAGANPRDVIGLTTNTIAMQRVSDEGQEGLRAFLEKRKPRWTV